MDPDYEQRLLRQINGLRTPTKNSPVVSLYIILYQLTLNLYLANQFLKV